jgi:hypothetical protein
MLGVAILRVEQYGEYRLFAVIGGGESTKNHTYFLEFEAEYKKPPGIK